MQNSVWSFIGHWRTVQFVRAHIVRLLHSHQWPWEVVFGRVGLSLLSVGPESGWVIKVEGWAFSRSGVSVIQVWLSDVLLGHATDGIGRADLAQLYPDIGKAAESGLIFLSQIPHDLVGAAVWKVVARTSAGSERVWTGVLDFGAAPSSASACEGSVTPCSTGLSANLASSDILVFVNEPVNRDGSQYERTKASIDYSASYTLRGCEGGFLNNIEYLKNTISDNNNLKYFSILKSGDILLLNAYSILLENVEKFPFSFIYGDEIVVDPWGRLSFNYKPAWSPRLLRDFDYIGRPWLCSREILISLAEEGGLLGCENVHQLVQRLTARASSVIHVAVPLCQRSHEKFPASESQVPLCIDNPNVSVVIPSCLINADMTRICVESLRKYANKSQIKIILILNNCPNYEEKLKNHNISVDKIIYIDENFNWSRLNNAATKYTNCEFLLFLNDDTEAIGDFWLDNMVSEFKALDVGVVGAQLLYRNRTVQHLGLGQVNQDDGLRHLFRHWPQELVQAHRIARATREVSAVTGACLLTSQSCFQHLGGFDEAFPLVYNDIDFCFRAQEAGYRVLISPSVPLIHHESVTRAGMPEGADADRFRLRWCDRLSRSDPYGNPNIDAHGAEWAEGNLLSGEQRVRVVHNTLKSEVPGPRPPIAH